MFKNIENKSDSLISGGILAGILASVCCIGPLLLTVLGVSGAAALAKFEVIRLPMIILVIILFTVSGFSLFRKRKNCEPGSICADPKKWRWMVRVYIMGLIIAILAITSPYWVIWIFN